MDGGFEEVVGVNCTVVIPEGAVIVIRSVIVLSSVELEVLEIDDSSDREVDNDEWDEGLGTHSGPGPSPVGLVGIVMHCISQRCSQ